MKSLRTPNERFDNLPGYPFAPHYLNVPDGEGGRLRIHYVDEGPKEAEPVLLIHGEPSWSYLYRKMIPIFVQAGYRAVAPDDPAALYNRNAWEVLQKFEKPFLTAFSDGDPITRGGDKVFQKLVPGAKGQPHTIVQGGGHFLQEDRGEELAGVIVEFMARTLLT
jgi:pimeloyl-ACP methyl ester carboxylesterase